MSRKTAQCPRCDKKKMLDALSRRDNKSEICAQCGTEEALVDMAIAMKQNNHESVQGILREIRFLRSLLKIR